MGTLTLINNGATYTSLGSLMSAVHGVDFGSPAIAELSGSCELYVGIHNRSFPKGLIVRAAAGEEFNGIPGSGGAKLTTTSESGGDALEARSYSLLRFENIELESLGQYCRSFFFSDEYNHMKVELDGCFINAPGGATGAPNGRLLRLRTGSSNSQKFIATNCVIATRGGMDALQNITGAANTVVTFENCTAYECNNRNTGNTGVSGSPLATYINNYIVNSSQSCIGGDGSTSSYVATSDGTAQGVGAIINVAKEDVFTSVGTDFTQKQSSPLLAANGSGGAVGYMYTAGGVSDVTPPVITLNAPASIDIVEGGSYTVAAATASDDTDGDITANIVVGGATVDVNTVGAYVVTFNVVDAAGNAATEVTQTVNITAAPAVVPQGIVTIGTITKTDTTASISLTYSLADQTGFEYRIDGGVATTGASPIPLSGLTQSTTYTIEVRAVNAVGAGNWSTAVNFTTNVTVLRGVLGSAIPTNSAIDTSNITVNPAKYYYAVVQLPEPHGLVFTEDGSNFRWIDIQNALNNSFVTNDVYSFDIEIFEDEASLGIKTVDVKITA